MGSVHPINPYGPGVVGKGGWFWGAPSAAQMRAGMRPRSLNPFKTVKNVFSPRQYANDPSFARRMGRGLMYGGAFAGVDAVMNTRDRLRAAGELGYARSLYDMRQGDTWDRLKRGLGMTFMGDQDLAQYIAQRNPNVGQNYWYMSQTHKPADSWNGVYNTLLSRPMQ